MFPSLFGLFGFLVLVPNPAISEACNSDNPKPVNVPLSLLNGLEWNAQEYTYTDELACTKFSIVVDESGQTGKMNFTTDEISINKTSKINSISRIETSAPGVFELSPLLNQYFEKTTMTVIYYQKDDSIVFHECHICDGDSNNNFIVVATKNKEVTAVRLTEIKKAACVFMKDGQVRQFKKVDQTNCVD